MASKCILDEKRKGGCAACDGLCAHRIAIHGLDGTGGRVGAAGVPSDYRYTTLANSPAKEDQAALYETLDKYAKTFDRQFDPNADRIKSFYFHSTSPGTGKTTTAVALLNEYISVHYIGSLKRGIQPLQAPAMFFDVNQVQRTYNLASQAKDEDTIKAIMLRLDRAAKVPFLVMDDIGIRNATDAFRALLHDVINHRTSNGMPTVYTSNVKLSDFATIYDARLADRVRDKCAVVEFKGKSKRGK